MTTATEQPNLEKPQLEPLNGEVEATGKHVRIAMTWEGEGTQGEYNEEDPKDAPMLRMDVMRRGQHGGEDADDDEWGIIRNGSFCTCMDARSEPLAIAEAVAKTVALLDRIPPHLELGSVELLSWIKSPDCIGTVIVREGNDITQVAEKA